MKTKLLNVDRKNERYDQFRKRTQLFNSKINYQFLNFISYYKSINPIAQFIDFEDCDMCERIGKLCYCCDNGVITYYFNSEPTGHNVIGINERMVND